jgi:Bacterial PH domain
MSPRKSRDIETDTDAPAPKAKKGPKIPGMQLQAGEQLIVEAHPGLASCWYKYLFTLGFYQIWHKRDLAVLTDRRVFVGRGVLSREEHSTPLRTIDSCSYFRRGLRGYCDITARIGSRDRKERVGPLAPRHARIFTRELDARS